MMFLVIYCCVDRIHLVPSDIHQGIAIALHVAGLEYAEVTSLEENIGKLAKGAEVLNGRRFPRNASESELRSWAEPLI